jgi:hypothetical protein
MQSITHGYNLWNELSRFSTREIYNALDWLFPSFHGHRNWFYLLENDFFIPKEWSSDTLYEIGRAHV